MTPSATQLTRGYTAALLSAIILSTTAIFIRYLTQTYAMPALVLALWRDGLVALTVLPVLALLRPLLLRVNRQHLRYLFVYGLVLALFNAIWVLSVALNGAAISTVLVYSSAAFTVLLGRWFLQESLGWVKLLAVVFSLGGCVLVSGMLEGAAWEVNPIGIVTGLLSGLWYAIYSLMGRRASQRGLNPWTTLFYTFAFATFFLLLFNLLPVASIPGKAINLDDLLWLGDAVAGWTILFLLAAGPTVLGFGLYNVSLSLLPSSVANLILTLEPVFTGLIAYLLLAERFTVVQVAGSLLILSGVSLLRLYEGRAARVAQPSVRESSGAI